MLCEVKLLIAGKVVVEHIEATDYAHAKESALARYGYSSKITVIGVNAIFPVKDFSDSSPNVNSASSSSPRLSSGGSDSSSSGLGSIGVLVLLVGLWLFLEYTPWVLSIGAGIISYYLVSRFASPNIAAQVAAALAIGGFMLGTNIQNGKELGHNSTKPVIQSRPQPVVQATEFPKECVADGMLFPRERFDGGSFMTRLKAGTSVTLIGLRDS